MTATATEICRFVDPGSGGAESVGYIEVAGNQVYTVVHAASKPTAAVLLCGPIGAERERAYRTLVDLARAIAGAGFVAMRFDYRGIGESTGRFEDLTLTDWRADIAACAAHLAAQAPGLPLALWGVRAGALLISESFQDGLGDAAMFCAPTSGREMLHDVLRRKLVADALTERSGRRTSREELVQSLARGDGERRWIPVVRPPLGRCGAPRDGPPARWRDAALASRGIPSYRAVCSSRGACGADR
jgi:hypothetical protein